MEVVRKYLKSKLQRVWSQQCRDTDEAPNVLGSNQEPHKSDNRGFDRKTSRSLTTNKTHVSEKTNWENYLVSYKRLLSRWANRYYGNIPLQSKVPWTCMRLLHHCIDRIRLDYTLHPQCIACFIPCTQSVSYVWDNCCYKP